jgi:hypothetical protein
VFIPATTTGTTTVFLVSGEVVQRIATVSDKVSVLETGSLAVKVGNRYLSL